MEKEHGCPTLPPRPQLLECGLAGSPRHAHVVRRGGGGVVDDEAAGGAGGYDGGKADAWAAGVVLAVLLLRQARLSAMRCALPARPARLFPAPPPCVLC